MQKIKRLNRIGTKALLIIAIALTTLLSFGPVASAADDAWCKDVSDSWFDFGIGIDCGEEISFSKFEGSFNAPTADGYDPGLTRVTSVRSFILTFVNFALSFLGLIAIVIVIYGGVLYVTSRGEQDQADKGKKAIGYAVVGILIILASFALVNTLLTEPFENIQTGNEELHGSGSAVFVNYNPMATQVNTSARDLVSMYALYKEVNNEIKVLGRDAKKFSVNLNDRAIVQYIGTATSRLTNMRSKLPAVSDTRTAITEVILQLDLVTDAIDEARFLQARGGDEDPVKVWEEFADNVLLLNDATEGSYGSVKLGIKNDMLRVLDKAMKDIQEIQVSEAGSLAEVQSLTGNLLGEAGLSKLVASIDGSEDGSGVIDNDLVNVLAMYKQLIDVLSRLEFVRAVISADVIEGNAPLVVNFNMLDSIDPAGQTITPDRVEWDLNGDGTFGSARSECSEQQGTFASCIFTEPGTYQASVRVASSDSGRYASGQATIPIKVLPRTASIRLAVNGDDMVIYDGDQLLFEKNNMKVTLEEAKAAVEFDASGTTSGAGEINEITSFIYSFGDGFTENFSSSDTVVKHAYGESGTYKVVFEVQDKLGNRNRKIFDLVVGSPVARINITPSNNAFLGDEINFDGSRSASEVGQITSYNWEISNESGLSETIESFEKSFSHVFEEPGNYLVKLTVQDALGDPAETTTKLFIKSQPPVSRFDYKIQAKSQPSTVNLYGSRSFDPDGDIYAPDYTYLWEIQPEASTVFLEGDSSSLNPIVRFEEIGEYNIKFIVRDGQGQGEAVEETLLIDDLLDIAWDPSQEVAAQLDANAEANMDFKGISRFGTAYEIDFGDGESAGGDIVGDSFSEGHTYSEAGRYTVTLTVFDDKDNDKSISRQIFIGDGTKPKAAIKIFVDGVEIDNTAEPIIANRSTVLTFDASDSKNVDGTGRKLDYLWDFDDSSISTKKTATHTYKELPSRGRGRYDVKLTVTDKDDSSKKDSETIDILVVSELPDLLGLVAVPQTGNGLETPVKVKVEAIGAIDKDGRIVKYKWYYYDTKNSSNELGVQVTETRQSTLTIGTRGKEGQESTYIFSVEMTDDENNVVDAEEVISRSDLPRVTVINGKNDLPFAKFKADRTGIFTGESITFSSESNDPDGEVVDYIWDFEGDGFADNRPTNKATVTHKFEKKAPEGISIGLKVIDDKYGEAVASPITIFVESRTEDPKAAFKYKIVNDQTVQFENNSAPKDGPAIVKYIWDFDTSSDPNISDSDGDGVKDNDNDSNEKNPKHTFPTYGVYQVKLTAVDSAGNEDSTENFVNVPGPVNSGELRAAFKTEKIGDSAVRFVNNSQPSSSGEQIVKYIWDFDVSSNAETADSDGDGEKDNDQDSNSVSPSFTYAEKGAYQVKLTVIDAGGVEDFVINTVDLRDGADLNGGNEDGGTSTPNNGTPSTPDDPEKIPVILKAVFTSNPPASKQDGKIHLSGAAADITFNFANSTGEIVSYKIDKNIFFDTDGNGIPNDDGDTVTTIPGTWKSNFEAAWGKTVVKLTVYDKDGNSDSILREVIFDDLDTANLFSSRENMIAGILVLIAFIGIAAIIYKVVAREPTKINK